jgi:hypothetical protein
MSLFNNQSQSQSQTQGGGLFGAPQQNSSILGANNNNKSGGLFGNSSNPTNISFGANNTTGGNSLFGANTSSNQLTVGPNNSGNNQNNQQGSLFSFNNKGNQSNNLFGSGNQSTNLFGQNNTQNANNQQNQNTSSIFGNLSGINASNNQNNNPQQNNFFNQNRQNYIDINNPKNRHDLEEYKQILENVSNCSDPAHQENMFKDYLYMPIPKGIQPSDVNNYRPYTIVEGQQKIVNDYNIWEKASKNNVDPNKYFPIQISSVDALLNRYKNLEKGILQSIAKTVETQKSLEKINKKVDDEMNSKISEIKNCHTRLDKLQLGLSSKVAQYNYLLGTAKENVNDTQQIKDNIKKTNDNINKNNMIEVSDKIKKCSIEEIPGETKNYIKELNKDKINYMFDALVEIQNMMNVVNTNNKRNLNIVNGMNKEIERILKKNQI